MENDPMLSNPKEPDNWSPEDEEDVPEYEDVSDAVRRRALALYVGHHHDSKSIFELHAMAIDMAEPGEAIPNLADVKRELGWAAVWGRLNVARSSHLEIVRHRIGFMRSAVMAEYERLQGLLAESGGRGILMEKVKITRPLGDHSLEAPNGEGGLVPAGAIIESAERSLFQPTESINRLIQTLTKITQLEIVSEGLARAGVPESPSSIVIDMSSYTSQIFVNAGDGPELDAEFTTTDRRDNGRNGTGSNGTTPSKDT